MSGEKLLPNVSVRGSDPDVRDEVGVTLDVRPSSFPGRMTGPGDPLGLRFTEVLLSDRPVVLLGEAKGWLPTCAP